MWKNKDIRQIAFLSYFSNLKKSVFMPCFHYWAFCLAYEGQVRCEKAQVVDNGYTEQRGEKSLRFSNPELGPEQFRAMAPFHILCAASFLNFVCLSSFLPNFIHFDKT